jgi:hypothetical protein
MQAVRMAVGALLVDRGWLRHREMMRLQGPAGERGGPLPAKMECAGTNGEVRRKNTQSYEESRGIMC